MGSHFAVPEEVLERLLGVPGELFGCLWGSLGSSWAASGGLWEALGLFFGFPGVLLEVFLSLWTDFGAFLGDIYLIWSVFCVCFFEVALSLRPEGRRRGIDGVLRR